MVGRSLCGGGSHQAGGLEVWGGHTCALVVGFPAPSLGRGRRKPLGAGRAPCSSRSVPGAPPARPSPASSSPCGSSARPRLFLDAPAGRLMTPLSPSPALPWQGGFPGLGTGVLAESGSPRPGKMASAPGTGVLLLLLLVVSLPEPQSARPSEHFLYQMRCKCHFPNGVAGPGAYYLERYFWGHQEYVRFDSRLGIYEAVQELGQPTARRWNSDKAYLEQKRANLNWFCRHNYGIYEPFVSARKLKPQLQITPTDTDPSSGHTLLVCTVAGFFPAKIDVKWLRNGQEEEESRVVSTELIRNGDWTFSIQVMLEAQPERGDVYACQVEHASLPGPTSIQWEPQSDSVRSKMWTGVVGLQLGLVFVVSGLALYLRDKKGPAISPPAGPGTPS